MRRAFQCKHPDTEGNSSFLLVQTAVKSRRTSGRNFGNISQILKMHEKLPRKFPENFPKNQGIV